MELGEKVKQLRNKKKLTIKQMSELTGLSTGFISQFERGITTIDVAHLNNIAAILDTDITTFFSEEAPAAQGQDTDVVIRGYQRPYVQNLNRSVHFDLSRFPNQLTMAPEFIEIMPSETKETPATYAHDGEEFIYVLEGILTFYWEGEVTKMYPGDAAHYPSDRQHNWANMSDSVVKILVVHAPTPE